MSETAPVTFAKYKESIIAAIKNKVSNSPCNACQSNGFILLEGFINQPLQNEFTGGLVIGGPSIPMIAVACSQCGRINYYALKVLLPEIKL